MRYMLPHRASWHGRKDEYLFLRPTRRRTTDGASVAELLTGDLHAFAVERVENDRYVTLDQPYGQRPPHQLRRIRDRRRQSTGTPNTSSEGRTLSAAVAPRLDPGDQVREGGIFP